MDGLRPIEMPSVHEALVAGVKDYIVANGLRAGDPLPSEAQLAGQLHVSRSGVREALRSLQSLGVITSRRGDGHYVNSFNFDPIVQNLNYSMLFDVEDAHEVLEVRERLELSFIGDAAAAMNEGSLEVLRALVAAMRRRADQGRLYLEEDIAFHRTIYETVGNRLLIKLLDVFWDVYNHLRDRSLLDVRDLHEQVSGHEQILRALEARDGEAARHYLVPHFANIEARLTPNRPRQEAGDSTAARKPGTQLVIAHREEGRASD
jgi:DNA-binding FadR family transcriptional regulator